MDNQEISPQALIAAYRDAHARDPQAQVAILRGANLANQDLSELDLSAADLSNADLSHCTLCGTNLSGAVTEGTLFPGILIGDLLATGLTPSAILNTRDQANEQFRQTRPAGKPWEAMVFTPETTMTTRSASSLSDTECQYVCDSLSTMCWEDLSNSSVFQALYPGVPWHEWILPFALGGKRAILDWVAHHWKTLEECFRITWLDEWAIDLDVIDLSDSIAIDPWQVVRQVAWQEALSKESPVRQYPSSPWGNTPEITQIRNSAEARYEVILLPSPASTCFQDYTSYLEHGILFLYHIGPPVPAGSTALLSSSGRVWDHQTRAGEVTHREQQLLNEWLATFGTGGKAYRWTNVLPREVLSMQQVLLRLRQAGTSRVIWDINWFADDTQCTVLACYTEKGKQVFLPQPLDDIDFWRMTIDEPGVMAYPRGTFELLVQQERIRSLDNFLEQFANRWNWTE